MPDIHAVRMLPVGSCVDAQLTNGSFLSLLGGEMPIRRSQFDRRCARSVMEVSDPATPRAELLSRVRLPYVASANHSIGFHPTPHFEMFATGDGPPLFAGCVTFVANAIELYRS